MFPVKLGPEVWDVPRKIARRGLGRTGASRPAGRWALPGLVLAWLAAGCGYAPVYSEGRERYEVVSGPYTTSSFEAVQAAASGVRSELGAARGLGRGYPRVVVEVLRVDERSLGVSVASGAPLARGSEIVVVGRARVYAAPDAPPGLDTGDMSRAATFASSSTPSAEAAARGRAVRDAATSLGHALGRALLGLPEALDG